MPAVNLRPKLAEQLRPEAERYYAQHTQLRAQYADKVIAMRDGEVVDSGDELLEVFQRVRERFGDEPILITRVGVEPVETYTIRSPRLETPIP